MTITSFIVSLMINIILPLIDLMLMVSVRRVRMTDLRKIKKIIFFDKLLPGKISLLLIYGSFLIGLGIFPIKRD